MFYVYDDEMDQSAVKAINVVILIIIYISYYKAVTVDVSQTNLEEISRNNPKRLLNFDYNLFKNKCNFCENRMKFERSSHCTACRVCIIRRDHHCIWIGQCVGYANTQYFLNFCFWVFIVAMLFMSSYIKFYNLTDEQLEQKAFLNISFTLRFLMGLLAFFYSCCSFGIVMLIIKQLGAVLNETSYNELRKNPNLESYYICCKNNNDEMKNVSSVFTLFIPKLL